MSQSLVLVADDDEDIVRFVEVNLRLEGFDVITASDGKQALDRTRSSMPDLVLLDIMMPEIDGFEVCQRLRGNYRTAHIIIVMLSAKRLSADKVVGLVSGADDYMIKPFDPIELVARVRSNLQRADFHTTLNPLTRLPGGAGIEEEIYRRLNHENDSFLYFDLDHFKAFNDHYGFARGNRAIALLAECISEGLDELSIADAFLGHVGGDDFVAIVESSACQALCAAVIDKWDRSIPNLYDKSERDHGGIVGVDRDGQLSEFPIASVSIAVIDSRPELDAVGDVAKIAAQLKHRAKAQVGSCCFRDERKRLRAD